MNRIFAMVIIIVLSVSACQAPLPVKAQSDISTDDQITDPPPQPQSTKELIEYLKGLPSKERERVISGQMIGQGEGALIGYEERVEALYESTGKWVGLIGVDYGFGKYKYDSWDLSSANQLIIDYWHQGGLVTISWAARSPWTDGPASDKEGADLVELITPGTASNEIWMKQLDYVAASLAELRDAGVLVLWRPFHEMNGEWFWWGSETHPHDADPFIDLWQHMHNYFSDEKGLDNLLWVYSASQRESPPADFYYPGDEYVDIVGEDCYVGDVELNGYERLTALGKPYALTEFGARHHTDGSYDYTTLINTIREKYPLVTYWLSWNNALDNPYSMVSKNAAQLLNDPWVITREELDFSINEGDASNISNQSISRTNLEINDFTPEPVPKLLSPQSSQNQPLYFYLFTHTEDQFNHELSEQRYLRMVPEVEARAASNPEAHLTWTIMFQGSDAQTVAKRNPETGVQDLLLAAGEAGVVDFGFHGHHDPTYNNRPQGTFSTQSTWEELVLGMQDWLTCTKDPVRGGCLTPDGGGITAILEHYGEVVAASGIFLASSVAHEGGPSSHVVSNILPYRLLGFGYPDHGPFGDQEKRAKVAVLMERLTPTSETSSTVFWADNVIKMTGGSPIDGTRGIDTLKGPHYGEAMLADLDRSRPNLILTHLVSKFVYTKSGTSPTIYGYAHPDAPELPDEWLNSPQQIEKNYHQTLDGLDYLLDEVLPSNPGSRFVSSEDVVNMVAPPEYWTISADQLDVMSRWALINWTDRPPDWVSDGTVFYSLRDLFTLLVLALGEAAELESIDLPTAYGPLEPVDASAEIQLTRDEIIALAKGLAPNFAPDQPWQVTPNAMVQPTYSNGADQITAAQLLYGMATIYAADYTGTPVITVNLPATLAMPVTYDLLQDIGCLSTCSGTAWSFKPARLLAP